jgi:hypothetical protein
VKNAAALLADLIASWDLKKGDVPATVRRESLAEAGGLWDVQKLAITYLLQIETDIDAMHAAGDEVTHYRQTLGSWYEAVHSWNAPWQDAAAGVMRAIDPRDLRLLYALAGQIDSLRLSPPVPTVQLPQLRVALTKAQELIAEAVPPVLDDAARRYLLGLVFEANRCIDEIELRGAASLRRVTFELGGAMTTIAEQATDENAKKAWREKAKGILIQWSGLVPVTAITTGVAEGIKAIGS